MNFVPLYLVQQYKAIPESLFDAWTNPSVMKKWLFTSADNEIISVTADLKIGGAFSILELNKGEKIDHFGQFLEIDRPRRLVFTLEVPWHFDGISYVLIRITPAAEGAELEFVQAGIDTSKTESSWRDMLQKLSEIVS